MRLTPFISPVAYPIYFFGLVAIGGALLLAHPASLAGQGLGAVDALFTAVSAVCVTGLVVVDTGAHFTRFGQSVILGLMQIGGLGIMTFTSLLFFLWRRRVRLSDRMAVGQTLLHDPSFHLGWFLIRLVAWTTVLEALGALALYLLDPQGFYPYSAFFHAVSAFCNAGFSLYADSLTAWRDNLGVNVVFMGLIVVGGIGFSVMVELEQYVASKFKPRQGGLPPRLSWYGRVVLGTTAFLIVGGALAVFLSEFVGYHRELGTATSALSSLFTSVTCRTAGFNTLDVGDMTNLSLIFMLLLMMVGGSPGSCAGGLKTTTFHTLAAFAKAQLLGREQTVIGRFAVDKATLSKALSLLIFAGGIIITATLVLTLTEGGDRPHPMLRGQFLELLFEAVSAYCTVGLSMGITAKLSVAGKLVITALMFVGRLGPFVFLAVLGGLAEQPHYRHPEESMLIG